MNLFSQLVSSIIEKKLRYHRFALRRKKSETFREEVFVVKVFEALGYELYRTDKRILWFNIESVRRQYDVKGSVCVTGHGLSGSGAIHDFLKEFRGNMPVSEHEFRLVKERGGLMDLEDAWQNWSHWNSNSAIEDFLYVAKIGYRPDKYSLLGRYRMVGLSREKERVPLSIYKFVDNISLFDFNGFWWVDKNESILRQIKKMLMFKAGRLKFRVIDPKANYPKHVKSLLKELREEGISDVNYKYAVYDASVDPSNISKFEKYFDNLKTIVVIRDPRDQFISFRRNFAGTVPMAPEKFCKLYRTNMEMIDKTQNTLVVKFEDFVVNFSLESKRIMDFLGLDEEDHLLKGKYFKRHKSIKKIQKWETYDDFKSIDYIVKTIPEYCYADSYEI